LQYLIDMYKQMRLKEYKLVLGQDKKVLGSDVYLICYTSMVSVFLSSVRPSLFSSFFRFVYPHVAVYSRVCFVLTAGSAISLGYMYSLEYFNISRGVYTC